VQHAARRFARVLKSHCNATARHPHVNVSGVGAGNGPSAGATPRTGKIRRAHSVRGKHAIPTTGANTAHASAVSRAQPGAATRPQRPAAWSP